MYMAARIAGLLVFVSSLALALLLGGCEPAEDDYDIILPLQTSGHALSANGYGTPGPTTGSTDGAATEVWAASNDWAETTGSAAARAGMAWEANSGLNWEQKYTLWVQSMEKIDTHSGYSKTATLTTPWGKEMPIPALECAELSMTLRVLFASWYNLPFFEEARDGSGTRIYFGHFGARTNTGRYRNTPNYRTRYQDYTGLGQSDIDNNWPSDSNLRGKHIYGGGSDNNPFMGDDEGAGAYFDEILLNKRVGHFLMMFLPYFGSVNISDDANAYHVQADQIRAGDILLKRWQKRGIGHVMVVKMVEPIGGGRLTSEIFSGSMPRRQGVWESPAASKMAYTNDYTGGEGENYDGEKYVDLGGGLKRWLAPQRNGGKWRQRVIPADKDEYIQWSDKETRAARPARFDELLGEPDPELMRDELLAIIEAKREHLRNHPSSCSAREGREQAFETLYELMDEKFDMSRDQVDEEYRILDDYVFGELVYNQSKTCCWNSTNRAMYDIIMDLANKSQEETCKTPTVFKAEDGDYRRWADHAAAMDRGSEWVAWSADETCPQGGNTGDDIQKVYGWTPWCEITGDPDPVGDDPYEVNDDAEHAASLEPGTYDGTRIVEGDEDWFTFPTAATGSVIRFAIDFSHAEGDLDVRMYRGDQKVDSGTSSSDNEVVDTTYDGTQPIYVQVFGYRSEQNAAYKITVTFEGGEDLGPACSNSDDTMETAIELGAGTYNGLAICPDDNVDWIRIPATTGAGNITIEFDHGQGDLDMALFKSNGTEIANATSSDDNETLDSPPGLRFLKVYGYSGASAPYSLIIED